MSHTTRLLPLTLLATLIVGCADSTTEPVDSPLAGNTYTLESMNGQALPFEYEGQNHTTVFGTLAFVDGSRWEMLSRSCDTPAPCDDNDLEDVEPEGSYTLSGNQISFTETSPGILTFTGEIRDDGDVVYVDLDHPARGRTERIYVR